MSHNQTSERSEVERGGAFSAGTVTLRRSNLTAACRRMARFAAVGHRLLKSLDVEKLCCRWRGRRGRRLGVVSMQTTCAWTAYSCGTTVVL